MPRLVNADALRDAFTNGNDENTVFDIIDIISEIDAAPTVDAVLVVRCVDCRHVVTRETPRLVCGLDYEFVEPEHYCARGADMRERSDVV